MANLTTPKGTKLPITKNTDTNGYRAMVPGKGYHVQWWYDSSTRCWFCAPYINGAEYQADACGDSYTKDGILRYAGQLADEIAEGNFNPTYL